MMQFACHTWGFNDLSLPEALGTIARLGFRYVDIGSGQNLNAAKTAQNPQGEADIVRADLDMYQLKVSDVYLVLPRISRADDDQRQRDLDIYTALLPFVSGVGAPGVTVSAGLKQPDEGAWERMAIALQTMLEQAKAADLRLSIEPHLDSMIETPEDALKLLDEIDGLEITLDWAHMVCQGARHKDIESLLPKSRHVQLRQAAKNKLQTPFDKGKIDLEKVWTALVEAEYDGVVSVEYMKVDGWHGMMPVDAYVESTRMRDELRRVRDRLEKA
jgi:sugar phosphate isomerase/epimerase